MGLKFKHGDPLMVDYTTGGSAVTAGETVVYLGVACIAHTDIAANTLGALAWPNGSAVYEIEADYTFTSSEDTLSAGNTLYVESGGNLSDTSTSNYALGPVMADVADSAGAEGVRVIHGG